MQTKNLLGRSKKRDGGGLKVGFYLSLSNEMFRRLQSLNHIGAHHGIGASRIAATAPAALGHIPIKGIPKRREF
jgi:hypothetical protein